MSHPSFPGWKATGPSRDAAEGIQSHASTVRERVDTFLRIRAPQAFGADQIADAIGENILTVRPRISELKKLGCITAGDSRVTNRSGMTAHTWRIADAPNNEQAGQ